MFSMRKGGFIKINIGVAQKLRNQGYTLDQIAKRFGCTKQAVQQRLAYEHVSVPAGPEIMELIKMGFDNSKIAAIVGVTTQSVRYHRAKLSEQGLRC